MTFYSGFVREMAVAAGNGRPALEPGQARLTRALPVLPAVYKTANHLKQMIGCTARQVMEREGFILEPGSVRICVDAAHQAHVTLG